VVYLGTALPVIGVGLLAEATGLLPAVRTFAVVIALAGAAHLAVLLGTERRARPSSPDFGVNKARSSAPD
jgi:hypothetical protein